MTDVRDETADLVDSNPELEEALRDLLEVDEERPWQFDDISLDSGQFGEVVSRGIAESHDGGYRLTDPSAVEAALAGEAYEPETEQEESTADRLSIVLPTIDARWAGLLVLAVVFALLVRTVFVWQYVYKNGDVVLLKNDPWFYRYWTETLLRSGLSAWDLGALGNLPNGVTGGNEVLLIVTLWWAAALLGGTPHAAGTTVAWYPVVVAAIVMVLIYLIARRIGKDRRVGLAAVLVGSVFGILAQRTALGYGDHHAFDLLWLSLGLFSITVIVGKMDISRSREKWRSAGAGIVLPVIGLGVAIAGQIASWTAGAILILPVGGVALLTSIAAVRRGQSPGFANLPIVFGTAIGAAIPFVLDSGLGWLSPDRVLAPAVLFAGVVAVTIVGELGYRQGLSSRVVAGVQVVLGIAGFTLVWLFVPELASAIRDMLQYFQGLAGANISETIPLLGPRAGLFMGPIYHFGFIFYLIIPYIGWGIWAVGKEDQPLAQVPAAVYGLFFLAFSLIQFRFALELGLATAVLGGLGLVHVASEFDLADPPNVFRTRSVREWREKGGWNISGDISLPSPRNSVLLVVLFVFLLNFALLTIPLGFSNFAVSDETYRTATWIEQNANQRNLEYPQNYVFSTWDRNRLYNYFASGHSLSYGYAQANYEDFLGSNASGEWYTRLRKHPVGYIVTTDAYSARPEAMYTRLHMEMGSATNRTEGLAHYRAVFVSRSGDHKVFTLVPGATIRGTGPPNEQVTVESRVSAVHETFTYVRRVHTDGNGQYSVTVPYPGEYTLFNRTVSVNETAVRTGMTVTG
ncbi:MAG: STT3 domain-containing protein [Halodesulfurarchaeum sp.]